MALVRATAVLNRRSGVPEDASHNVWHFTTVGGPTLTDYQNIASGLSTFYIGLEAILATTVARTTNAHRIDLAAVTPGAAGAADDVVSPIAHVHPFSIPTAGSQSLPSEVAIALSFQGDLAGLQEESGQTRPRARRRGRVFLGPVGISTMQDENATTWEQVITLAAREAILDAYDNMLQVLYTADPLLRHVVYSRSNADTVPVESVRVDNQFDTMRSRGRKPSIRMVRNVIQGQAQPARSGVDVTLAA